MQMLRGVKLVFQLFETWTKSVSLNSVLRDPTAFLGLVVRNKKETQCNTGTRDTELKG